MQKLSSQTLVCGTIIILAPVFHDLIGKVLITHLLATDPKGDFHINGALNSSYYGWCIFIGICLLTVGVFSGFKTSLRAEEIQPSVALKPTPADA